MVSKSVKAKRGRREGDGTKKRHDNCNKRHDNSHDILRQFVTFYDNVRLFVPLT